MDVQCATTKAQRRISISTVGKLDDSDLVFLKADVLPSQSKTSVHSAWVFATSSVIIKTFGCSCIAGQGKSCSHAAVILWKVSCAKEWLCLSRYSYNMQIKFNSYSVTANRTYIVCLHTL